MTWDQLENEEPYITDSITYCYLTKNLPLEVIELIISYLNPTPREFFILALSKLFLPALMLIPDFLPKIHTFFLHSLLTYFTTENNLNWYFKPFIYENQFFFSFSTYIIDQNPILFEKNDLTPITSQFTNLFSDTFTPQPYYFPLYDCTIFGKCLPCYHLTFVCDFYGSYSKLVPITQFCNCTWHYGNSCYLVKLHLEKK